MSIKQELPEFLKENQLSKGSPTLYHTYYKIGNYEYFPQQNKHILTIVSKFRANQRKYKLEKEGDLHPELLKCLQNREEMVYFWSYKELKLSDPFAFKGEGYYWTIFPRETFIEAHNAQDWLNQNFPTEKRSEETKIRTNWWINLQGDLDLGEFTNLKEISCSENQLTSLIIGKNYQLEKLSCSNNLLTNIDLLLAKLNPKKLKELDLNNNNFPESNLNPFSKFTNLESLSISNNNFTGSLESLKDLTKLQELRIQNTDIDDGLEFLPNSLKEFQCYDADNQKQGVKSTELYEKELHSFNGNIQTWKEFYNSPAREWLDRNYPESKEKEEVEDSIGLASFSSLEKDDGTKERSEIPILDISIQELHKNDSLKEDEYLEGALKLKGFTELRKLYCSDNKLTNLDLYDCSNLIELDISNNEFQNLEFLKSVAKLELLSISNNQKLSRQDLRILTSLKELKELNISNCPLEGSLKSLANLSKLEVLRISNTNIDEGLEQLSTSCKKLYCDSDYKYKSIKIIKELDKSKCSEGESSDKYYNLDKWREDKANNIITSVVPLERLFVIRSNIKKFVNKWGIKEKKPSDNDPNGNWYAKLNRLAKNQEENNLSELSKLQSPEQFNKHWYWTIPQWVGRAAVGGSGILSFYGYQVGAVAVASPVIETVTSYAKRNWYETKEKAWEEFVKDSEDLLDNYHELKGIIETIKTPFPAGKVYQALTDLKEKIQLFLDEYDKIEKDGTIDIFELQKGKAELAQDLNKEQKDGEGSQLGDIIREIRNLELKINNYRQGISLTEEEKNNQPSEIQEDIQNNFLINIEDFDQETNESRSQLGNISDANSSSPILGSQGVSKGKKNLPVFSNLAKRRKKMYSQDNKTFNSESNESYKLQSQEQVAQTLHVPFGNPGSSK